MEAGAHGELAFTQLPNDVLKRILQLACPADVARFACTSKHYRDLANDVVVWKDRLYNEFGIACVATPPLGRPNHASLYADIASSGMTHNLRFQALYTNGGVDNDPRYNPRTHKAEAQHSFRADNLFTPNTFEAHCSSIGKNVSCFGILSDLLESGDDVVAETVANLQELLRHAYTYVALGAIGMNRRDFTLPLEEWSLQGLTDFFADVWGAHAGANHRLRRLLFQDCTTREILTERQALIDKVLDALKRPPPPSAWQQLKGTHVVVDLGRAALLSAGPGAAMRTAGVVERLDVCRQGAWSCPIRTGAVALAVVLPDARSQPPPLAALEGEEELQAAAREAAAAVAAHETPATRLLGECTSLEQVLAESERGRLPVVLSVREVGHGEVPTGVVVEFERAPFEDAHVLWPAVWFQFYNEDERARAVAGRMARQQREMAACRAARAGQRASEDSREGVLHGSTDSTLGIRMRQALGFPPSHPVAGDPEAAAPEAAVDEVSSRRRTRTAEEAVREAIEMSRPARRRTPPPPVNTPPTEWICPLSQAERQERSEGPAPAHLRWVGTEAAAARRHAQPILRLVAGDVVPPAGDEDGEDDELQRLRDMFITPGATRMRIPLERRRAGNLACVKLIDQQNLMRAFEDPHPNPNIDVVYVAFHGRKLRLPVGVRLGGARG